MLQTFIDRETRIKKAIERVKTKLQYFKDNSDILPESVLKHWNDWHDLHDRLINRLVDNWSDYKKWHFETYQFNTY